MRREVPWQELPEWRLAEASEETLPDEALVEKQQHVRLQAALTELPAGSARSRHARLSRRLVAKRNCNAPGAAAGNRQIAHAHRLPEGSRRTRGSRMTITHHLDDATLMSFAAGSLPNALAALAAAHVADVPALPARAENAGTYRRRAGIGAVAGDLGSLAAGHAGDRPVCPHRLRPRRANSRHLSPD